MEAAGRGRDRRRRAQAHAHAWSPPMSSAESSRPRRAATADGHLAAIAWAARWSRRRWALEDCRHLTRTLEADCCAPASRSFAFPTQMMAGVRRSARQPGKSDAIDALAVARAAGESPICRSRELDGPSRQVRLLVDHRDDLVGERTRIQSRLRWHLHEIAPDSRSPRAASSSNTSSSASPTGSPRSTD